VPKWGNFFIVRDEGGKKEKEGIKRKIKGEKEN